MKLRKITVIIGTLIFIQAISLITIVYFINQNSSLQWKLANSNDIPPKIEGIEFLDMNNQNVFDGNWATVPPDGKLKIRFKIKGSYSAIDMFITPAGSQTYLEQKRIDTIDITTQRETEYLWSVPKGTHGHFEVIVYNGMVGTKSDIYGINYE